MCISAIIGIASVAASAAGTILSYNASQKSADIEERKMELEADRHRRQAYRNMLRAQADSESAGASAGALASSGPMGGINQAANSGAQSIRDTNQNEQLSHEQYSARRQEALGGMVSGIGSGLGSLGNAFVKNQDAITRIGRTGNKNRWATVPSIWEN